VLLLGAVQGCAVLDHLSPSRQRGLASWYGPGFYGETTAGGTVYTGGGMTAAHPRFPFGTRVRVTNLENGRRVVVVIDDRGPFVHGRIIDLSEAAAARLGMLDAGVVRVRLKVLAWGSGGA
jgi:rare lipoprotein A